MQVGHKPEIGFATAIATMEASEDAGLSTATNFAGPHYMDSFGHDADKTAGVVHGIAGGVACYAALYDAFHGKTDDLPYELAVAASEFTKTAGYMVQIHGSPILGASLVGLGTLGTLAAAAVADHKD